MSVRSRWQDSKFPGGMSKSFQEYRPIYCVAGAYLYVKLMRTVEIAAQRG